MDDTKFVSVWQPHDTVQAGLIRSTLEAANIPCYVNNENLASVHGGLSIGIGRMAVMVPENQAEKARELIRDLGVE